MKRTPVALCLALLFPLSGTAHAHAGPSCVTIQVPAPNSPFAYAQANLTGLRYALSAWNEGAAFDRENKDLAPADLVVALMRHTKQSSDAYTCASQVVSPYLKSADRAGIGSAAGYVVAVYDRHLRLNDLLLESLRSLSDSADLAKLAAVISTVQVERSKAWADLSRAITLSVMFLLDRTKMGPDGNLNTILLTRAESDKLLLQMREDFPGVATASPATATPTWLASYYYAFLKRPLKRARG
jgi:hypothetical protein